MTHKEVLQTIKDKGVVMVDLKFIDLLGTWQHFTALRPHPYEFALYFDAWEAFSRYSTTDPSGDSDRPGCAPECIELLP